jgi:hypothetical protein
MWLVVIAAVLWAFPPDLELLGVGLLTELMVIGVVLILMIGRASISWICFHLNKSRHPEQPKQPKRETDSQRTPSRA